MQVAPSGGKNWNQCKWRHLVAKFKTNASGANSWPDLQAKQVAPSRCQIYNHCKSRHLVAKIGTNPSEATFKLISVRKHYFGLKSQYPRSVVPLEIFIEVENENDKTLCKRRIITLASPTPTYGQPDRSLAVFFTIFLRKEGKLLVTWLVVDSVRRNHWLPFVL